MRSHGIDDISIVMSVDRGGLDQHSLRDSCCVHAAQYACDINRPEARPFGLVATNRRRWIGNLIGCDRMQMGINDSHCARLDPPDQLALDGII